MIDIHKIVILTGAGISKESGLSTFRDPDGEWSKVRIEDVCTPEALEENPLLVNSFYNERRAQLQTKKIEPNAAHHAIALLEKKFQGDVHIVTQNIDHLHESAGSTNIIHIHGELLRARCQSCGKDFTWIEDITEDSRCPECASNNKLRPHVVFFGEMPFKMDTVYALLEDCDLFISIGTSGNVYPAAGFVDIANKSGAQSVELNLEPSIVASNFHKQAYGPATEIVPEFINSIIL